MFRHLYQFLAHMKKTYCTFFFFWKHDVVWAHSKAFFFIIFFKEIPLVFLFSLQRDIGDLKEEQSILFFLCFSNHEKKKNHFLEGFI